MMIIIIATLWYFIVNLPPKIIKSLMATFTVHMNIFPTKGCQRECHWSAPSVWSSVLNCTIERRIWRWFDRRNLWGSSNTEVSTWTAELPIRGGRVMHPARHIIERSERTSESGHYEVWPRGFQVFRCFLLNPVNSYQFVKPSDGIVLISCTL